jgi:hypothetical protein
MGGSGEPPLPLVFTFCLLFFCPGLRHVLNARLAFVADQYERQCVLVRPTELVNARAFAGFGNWPDPPRFLNCDGITCNGIVAPDLCLWLRSHHVKRAVRIDCPDGAIGVRPCAGERGWTRWSSRARTYQGDQNACKNDSEKRLDFHGGHTASQ